jgi:hypothetical protein
MTKLSRIFLPVVLVALVMSACSGDEEAGTPALVVGVSPSARDGLSPGEVLTDLEAEVGTSLPGVRLYARWDDPFPEAFDPLLTEPGRIPVLSIAAHRGDGTPVPWHEIATAPEDSPLFEEMRGWVDRLAAYGEPIYVAFSHEPETEDAGTMGTPEDYVAAFRRMDELFGQAPNVRSAWVITAWSFTRGEEEPWYPGGDVVDAIGADGFNFHGCGQGDGEGWRTFDQIFAPAHAFAESQAKPMIVAEWGTSEDPGDAGRKERWIAEAHETLASQTWADVEVALYYHALGQEGDPPCAFWVDTSQASLAAFTALASDPSFGPVSSGASSTAPEDDAPDR